MNQNKKEIVKNIVDLAQEWERLQAAIELLQDWNDMEGLVKLMELKQDAIIAERRMFEKQLLGINEYDGEKQEEKPWR